MGVLQRNYVGQVSFPDGIINVLDPGNKNIGIHKVQKIKVFPGTYNCYVYINSETSCPISCQVIISSDSEMNKIAQKRIEQGRWRKCKSFLEVYNGVAGFANIEDSNKNIWDNIEDKKQISAENPNPINKAHIISDGKKNVGESFFVQCNNGAYTVHTIAENKKNIALEIRFW